MSPLARCCSFLGRSVVSRASSRALPLSKSNARLKFKRSNCLQKAEKKTILNDFQRWKMKSIIQLFLYSKLILSTLWLNLTIGFCRLVFRRNFKRFFRYFMKFWIFQKFRIFKKIIFFIIFVDFRNDNLLHILNTKKN